MGFPCCTLCKLEMYDPQGHPIGNVLLYQIIEDLPRLAADLKLGVSLHHIHEACLKSLTQ